MAGLKTRYKVAGIALLAFGALFTIKAGMQKGWIPTPAALKAFVPQKHEIATLGGNIQVAPAQSYDVPAAPESGAPTFTMLVLPWQANGSLILANGGPTGDSNTLMTKYAGANLNIQRQDDYGKMAEQIQKYATDFAAGKANPDGAAFVSIMGGGEAAWLAGLKPQMDKLHLHLVVFGVTGFSHGEDKCMGPDLKGNPQNARGAVIAASPRDGDWDVCVKFAADNNIPINSDGTAYDKDAINFVDTDGFQTADDKFITGACEDRNEVTKGVKTGKKVHVCVTGVATWTPGDVTVMVKKGGIVTWASTKEYDQQMPAVVIGIKEVMQKHPAYVVGMLRAIDRASFQIRTTPDGVHQMAVAEAKVFGSAGGDEANPSYWERYFAGSDSPDGKVNLGGSRVSTLAEVRDFLGMSNGNLDIYKGVYQLFGDDDVKYYPSAVSSIPAYEDVVDKSYMTAALEGVTMAAAKTTAFSEAKTITKTVSSKAVSLEFDNGKATLRPASRAKLVEIANSASQTNLLIRISGYTDNTGDSEKNVVLSRSRAQAVAQALNDMAPATFPMNRMEARGYGDANPVGDNNTADGRQANRRVEIILGQ